MQFKQPEKDFSRKTSWFTGIHKIYFLKDVTGKDNSYDLKVVCDSFKNVLDPINLQVKLQQSALRRILKSHLISWCGNFVETHSFLRAFKLKFTTKICMFYFSNLRRASWTCSTLRPIYVYWKATFRHFSNQNNNKKTWKWSTSSVKLQH